MRRLMKVLVIGCSASFLFMLRPVAVAARSPVILDTRDQGNMGQPDMRDPYGQDKGRSPGAQDNQGRPCMRDPYGHDQDRSRLDTGNQGRAFGDCAAEEPAPQPTPDPIVVPEPTPAPIPEPAPAPIPVPEPVVEPMPEPIPAPAPITQGILRLSWLEWFNRYTEKSARNLFYSLCKQVYWIGPRDSRLTGFDLYQQDPGEAGYHLSRHVEITALPDGQWQSDWSAGWPYLTSSHIIRNDVGDQVSIDLQEYRPVADWSVGTYRHYVVARDAEGRELYRTPIVAATYLGDVTVLRPAPSGVLESTPAFEWVNPPLQPISGWWQRLVRLMVFDTKTTEVPWGAAWDQFIPSATSFVYAGPSLTPGEQYYLLTSVYVNQEPNPDYCPCIGQSESTAFTVAP